MLAAEAGLGGLLDDLAITGHHDFDAAADLFRDPALCDRFRRRRRGVEHGESAASWGFGFHPGTRRVFAAAGNVLETSHPAARRGGVFLGCLWASLGRSLVRVPAAGSGVRLGSIPGR